MSGFVRCAAVLLGSLMLVHSASATKIIAHRGASAYLPEHSREAYLLAYGMGADFLEPDLVMSADGVLFSLHDATLEATTDVAEAYPGRAREDGHWYAADLRWDELRRLNLRERVEPETGRARYPGRWPPGRGEFRLIRFDELVELTLELNRMTGRSVGLYPELKFPSLHAEAGLDITAALVEVLGRFGLPRADLPLFIQCFEPGPLERLREAYGDRFSLIQLIGENEWALNEVDYDAMRSPEGVSRLARYADGIGAPLARLIEADGETTAASPLFRQARALGLAIHPYTFRRESMPDGVALEEMLALFMGRLGVEALFTDHPDVALAVRAARGYLPSR